jgi:hypothetical protein
MIVLPTASCCGPPLPRGSSTLMPAPHSAARCPLLPAGACKTFNGWWSLEEPVQWHITLKELVAVRHRIAMYQDDLRCRMVRLWEDNQAVVHVIRSKTSRSQQLMGELRPLMELLESLNITLLPDTSAASLTLQTCFRDSPIATLEVFSHFRRLRLPPIASMPALRIETPPRYQWQTRHGEARGRVDRTLLEVSDVVAESADTGQLSSRPSAPHFLSRPASSRPVSIAESQPALKVSFNRPRPRSQPARAAGRVCWLFIFFHGS